MFAFPSNGVTLLVSSTATAIAYLDDNNLYFEILEKVKVEPITLRMLLRVERKN